MKGDTPGSLDTKMSEGLGGSKDDESKPEDDKKEGKGNNEKEESKEGVQKGPSGNGDGGEDEKEHKNVTPEEAHYYHQYPIPGKYQIAPSKPLNNEKDLRLAYTPGVAYPCE